MNLNRP
jgi:predicted aspartyl protease